MSISQPYKLSRIAGVIFAIALLIYIIFRIRSQYGSISVIQWQILLDFNVLAGSIILLALNFSLETFRWKSLADHVTTEPFLRVFASYMAGIACALFTPAGLGDYPARIIYLHPKSTGKLRYTAVAVTGFIAQYLTVLFFGIVSLCINVVNQFNPRLNVLVWFALPLAFIMIWTYLKAERILAWLAAFRIFRKLALYHELAKRLPASLKLKVILLSATRFIVYNAQFLLFLHAFGVTFPLWHGAVLTSLFFFTMTLIPSFALVEVGIRGGIALLLFSSVSGNSIGILSASTLLWLCNIILPAIPGAFCIARIRIGKN